MASKRMMWMPMPILPQSSGPIMPQSVHLVICSVMYGDWIKWNIWGVKWQDSPYNILLLIKPIMPWLPLQNHWSCLTGGHASLAVQLGHSFDMNCRTLAAASMTCLILPSINMSSVLCLTLRLFIKLPNCEMHEGFKNSDCNFLILWSLTNRITE